MTAEEYFSYPAVNNSLLSLATNPRLMKLRLAGKIKDDEKIYFKIGAALDCMLTQYDSWDQDFEVLDVNKPTGLVYKFVTKLPPGINSLSPLEAYAEAYRYAGYKKSLEWVVNNFWESPEVVMYYRLLHEYSDKKYILSKDEYENILNARELIIANEFTYPYFHRSSVDRELLHQVPILFEYQGVECKALLDGVLIDHRLKTIEPFDLKTTGKSVLQFPESFMQFGYYRQCAFYEMALNSPTSPVFDLIQDGYKVLDYLFIVAETKMGSTQPAIIYRTNKAERAFGISGGYLKGVKYDGLEKLMGDYIWYKTNNYWEMPKDVFLNNGVADLNVIHYENNDELFPYTSDGSRHDQE